MFTITFTDGELYELGDAVSSELEAIIKNNDPDNNEAKYGSASNLLAIIRKIWIARSPDNLPDWLPKMEAKVAALRAGKISDHKAAAAVAKFKSGEAALCADKAGKAALKFKVDEQADKDGIRGFKPSEMKGIKLMIPDDAKHFTISADIRIANAPCTRHTKVIDRATAEILLAIDGVDKQWMKIVDLLLEKPVDEYTAENPSLTVGEMTTTRPEGLLDFSEYRLEKRKNYWGIHRKGWNR